MKGVPSRISLAAMSLILTALACSFGFSTAKINNVRLSSDEEGNLPKTVFEQEETIYLNGELTGAPDDTQLKTIWKALDVSGLNDETVIDEADLTTGSGAFTFFLQNENSLWLPGKYRVDLMLNDELSQSFEYTIEQSVKPEIQDLVLSLDEEGNRVTSSFKPEDSFYITGNLTKSPGGALVRTVWSAVNVAGDLPNAVIDEKEQQLADGKFFFSLSGEQSDWPSGEYTVDVYLNNELVETIPFNVEGGTATAEQLRMSKDQDGIETTTVYSPDEPFYLVTDIVNAPDEGIAIKVVWSDVEVANEKPEYHIIETYEGIAENGSFWASLTSDTGVWPTGRYQAELYLDGEIVQTLSFDVTDSGSASDLSGVPTVEGVYLAHDADGIEDTKVFAPGDAFFIVGEVVDAQTPVEIEATWMTENVPGFEPNEVISESEKFQFEEGSFSIKLANEAGDWTPGMYLVDLILVGKKIETIRFLVSPIKILNPHMAIDQDDSQQVTTYRIDQLFYLIFDLEEAPSDTKISTVWYQLGATVEDDIKLNDSDYTFGTGGYYVQLTSDEGEWEIGDYVVDLYVNDYFYTSVYFDVK